MNDERPPGKTKVISLDLYVQDKAPEDDPTFRRAKQGQRAVSGFLYDNYGLVRKSSPTKQRVSRLPPKVEYVDPSLAIPERVAWLLGPERIDVLRASLGKRGATAAERRARAYLAALLRRMDDTRANIAAATLLDADLRKIGDLRRREYPAAAISDAIAEIRQREQRKPEQPLVAPNSGRTRETRRRGDVETDCAACGQVFWGTADEGKHWLRWHECFGA